jgi:hypothetical protein
MAKNQGVVVFTAQGEFEEQQVRSFLDANGIETWVRGEALRKTHGLTLDGIGQVEVFVSTENEAEARRLLDEVERGGFVIDESHEG